MTETSITGRQPLDVQAARAALSAIVDQIDRRSQTISPFATYSEDVYLQSMDAAIKWLAEIVAALLPPHATPTVHCPACRQPVTANPDGTLPGHEINPGPKRSPICRFRGTVAIGLGG